MESLWIDINNGTPQFSCSSCDSCTSLMGTSLCNIKNRGCCYYYPKFTLLDIQRMSKSLKGLNTLETIKNNPQTIMKEFQINTKGYFDEVGYEKHLKNKNFIGENIIKDQSIFFKACPFVIPNLGCTIDAEFRTLVCNFFICTEIIDSAEDKTLVDLYLKERSSYAKWCDWENEGLKHLLLGQNIDLINNYNETIKYLQSISLSSYEFPKFPELKFNIKNLSV